MRDAMKMNLLLTGSLCAVALLLGGCTHQLTIDNLDMYRSFGGSNLDKPLRIGIATDAAEPEHRKLLDGVAGALRGYSATVTMPYVPNAKEVDVVASVTIKAEHNGSSSNFWINFPGFLIFAPAWHGYDYEVKYAIDCALSKPGSKDAVAQFQLPIALDIRHAAMNRTWTEVSWFEVGIIALIGGVVFMDYDASVTPLVSEKVESPLGKYIADEIVKRINASGQFARIDRENAFPGLATLRP
jgi:hypothetical protein